jgi:hypothetical protein
VAAPRNTVVTWENQKTHGLMRKSGPKHERDRPL